jgi:hypothetical protein
MLKLPSGNARGGRFSSSYFLFLVAMAPVFIERASAQSPVAAVIPASRDTSIYQNSPNNSGGGAAGIFAGTNGQGSPRRGLVAFDVAGHVPAGATIIGTELRMYLGQATGGIGEPVGLHRLTADWGEGTAGSATPTVANSGNGFTAALGDAIWNARFHSPTSPTPWTAPGATGDFASVPSSVSIITNTLDTPFFWYPSIEMMNDLRLWRDNPSTNFGWALIHQNESRSSSARAFYSSEATLNSTGGALDPAWRPTLTVLYLIPEPAGILLALFTGPLCLMRRR